MGTARMDHTATLLVDGRVLVTGGSDNSGALASAEVYDPAADSFTSVPAMSGPRTQHAATLLANGKVLVAGGTSNGLGTGALTSAEVYSPATSSSVTGRPHERVALRVHSHAARRWPSSRCWGNWKCWRLVVCGNLRSGGRFLVDDSHDGLGTLSPHRDLPIERSCACNRRTIHDSVSHQH